MDSNPNSFVLPAFVKDFGFVSRINYPRFCGQPIIVRKQIKCRGDSEIPHALVCDSTRKVEKHELIFVIS